MARPEDELLAQVLGLAKLLHIRSAHFRPAQTQTGRWVTAVQGDGKGYPDLTLVASGGVLFRELKATRGTVSPEQKAWLQALTDAGADAGVWRPVDWASGRIEAELRALRASSVARCEVAS